MEYLYDIITNPLFWALVSMFGLLASSTVVTNKRARQSRMLTYLSGFLFAIGRFMLVLPMIPQPRFNANGWHWAVGGILLAVGLVFVRPGFDIHPLNALHSKMKFRTKGLYSFVRNPIYLGELLISLGLAVLFRSIIGIALLPVWWAGFSLHILIEEESLERAIGPIYLEYKDRVKGRMIPLPPFVPESRPTVYPFKNLVFKGGGMKGAAYAGVIQGLEDHHVLSQIDRVAGSSAGAITSAILSFRLNAEDSINLMNSLDYSKIPQLRLDEETEQQMKENQRWQMPGFLEKGLNRMTGVVSGFQRLMNSYGWHSSEYFYNWLTATIAEQCAGNGMATFADFRKRGFRDLYVVAANVSRHQRTIFCADDTPDVAVADAVRMSMSIPLYFESIRFNGKSIGYGDYYVDGGLLNNYPIQIFDNQKYANGNYWYRDGINWETLGCYIFIPENEDNKTYPVHSIRDYASQIFECYNVGMQIAEIDNNKMDRRRTIMLSSCDVQPTDFDLKPGDPKYQELTNEGLQKTDQFLKNYRVPASEIEWEPE